MLAAVFLPRGYVARALIQLHETAALPLALARDATSWSTPERMKDRAAGLRTLLGSDYVLSRVLDDFGGAPKSDVRQRAAEIEDLRSDLSLDLAGSDYLELRLRGQTAEGLGRRLEIVLARFLEALTQTEALTAARFLVNKRKDELEAAEKSARHCRIGLKLNRLMPEQLPKQLAAIEVRARDRTQNLRLRMLRSMSSKARIIVHDRNRVQVPGSELRHSAGGRARRVRELKSTRARTEDRTGSAHTFAKDRKAIY